MPPRVSQRLLSDPGSGGNDLVQTCSAFVHDRSSMAGRVGGARLICSQRDWQPIRVGHSSRNPCAATSPTSTANFQSLTATSSNNYLKLISICNIPLTAKLQISRRCPFPYGPHSKSRHSARSCRHSHVTNGVPNQPVGSD